MSAELMLRATQQNWRLFYVRESDARFSKFRDRVLQRDEYRCVYCGFSSRINMSVINNDGDYKNNKFSNLVTACPLCEQCGFLESVGLGSYGGGTIIYMPSLTQVEINAMCHALFASMSMGANTETSAKNLYRDCRLRAQMVDQKLGRGMNQPSNFGRLLIETGSSASAVMDKDWMADLRLLPNYMRFSSIMRDYAVDGLQQLLEKEG